MCDHNAGEGCACARNARPEDGSAEQIRTCHGDTGGHPCVTDGGCADSSQMTHAPGRCSPEQIRHCHGEAEHSCR